MAQADNYYAVARGRKVGIYRSWPECKEQIEKFQNARCTTVVHSLRFKKFGSEEEAQRFILANNSGKSVKLSIRNPSNVVKAQEATSSKVSTNTRKRILKTDVKVISKRLRVNNVDNWDDAPIVYTDGACSNNGKSSAKAGWGVYWGKESEDNESGPVYGEPTNNRGELIAVEKALEKAIEKKLTKIIVRTDSNLLIQSLDNWIFKWKKNGWKAANGNPVKNQDLLVKIDELMNKIPVKYEHVKGHSGIEGNEMADELARKGAEQYTK